MKYFANWSVYTIKVVIPILRLIYIFIHKDPIFVASLILSMIVSTARIFEVCPAIRQFQLMLCLFLLLYKSIIHLCSFTLQPAKEITHFTIQFRSKTSFILRISTLLKLKITCSQKTAKKLSQFTNFSANMFLFGVRKSICTAPFPDARELLS